MMEKKNQTSYEEKPFPSYIIIYILAWVHMYVHMHKKQSLFSNFTTFHTSFYGPGTLALCALLGQFLIVGF